MPPITNAESTARGDVRITLDLTRDAANNITGANTTFVVNLNNFPAGSTWTLAHIHEGPSGVAGGVRVNTGLTSTTAIRCPTARSAIRPSPTSRSSQAGWPTRPW
ncbi:MAG: hypothetical protein H0W08_21940 [Acidobacteria bacterium]|nr:hypothetical protein [Acidobacteriota bacterium]